MTLLLDIEALDARRSVARGTLAPLAQGLRAELAPVLEGAIEIPREKALLSRTGGRCPRDGSFLRFDPLDPRHICPACGIEVVGELHDRFRPYWYQLWLAERVLHAAVLGVLLDDEPCIEAARRVLDEYSVRYLEYPNRDNVLGPSRPFFSTYLESIWLLQLVLAVDLLESSDRRADRACGDRVRDRIVEPSSRLIASYDESISNRQVWNDAAMLAAGALLDDEALIDRSLDGASGLSGLLGRALLKDGSWYEGENYHLFAHRGLWYGVTIAQRLGRAPSAALTRRFDDGFVAPFRTILPDLTYPSRRDSQYAVSIRQPRFAESCELGLAREENPRLLGMLARLYDPAVIARDTGRRASTADVERNVPATGLTRADLSWRSLLFAREVLPDLEPLPLESDLLPAQGIGILRRDGGQCFVALDYGRSGGGHGHPDRLNLLLSDGETRWFDDPGTGSYVDESLHWYRSTLAHTAPLVDGRSQARVDGELVAFQDAGSAGWMSATAELARGCHARRSVVVMDGYLVDRIEWESDAEHELALPLHGVIAVAPDGAPMTGEPAAIDGGDGREDGFSFLTSTERIAASRGVMRLVGASVDPASASPLDGWLTTSAPSTWWHAVAPGPPGRASQSLVLVRVSARRGTITSVWSWRSAVASAEITSERVRVTTSDGEEHRHIALDSGWNIQLSERDGVTEIHLGSGPAGEVASRDSTPATASPVAESEVLTLPFRAELGADHYRRSEESWSEAGRPTTIVSVDRSKSRLLIHIEVPRAERRFVDVAALNPLDNDPAAIHGDGVQLYVDARAIAAGWLLVPMPGSSDVGSRAADGWAGTLPLHAAWRPSGNGYALSAEIGLPAGVTEIGVDVLVNEISAGRTRRRGQLVMSGARGEFVYLRADRHERDRLLRFALPRD
jgi:hypothetical protein